jgi:hypothetical protein
MFTLVVRIEVRDIYESETVKVTVKLDPIDKLAEQFKEFPGIGERQSKRFVYFLLHKNPNYVKELGDNILMIKNLILLQLRIIKYF